MKPGGGAGGVGRLVRAFGYSVAGLRAAFANEAAFRQEAILLAVLLPLGYWLGADGTERALLIGSALLVPVVELLNTGIEAAIDRVGEQHHELAGKAKDVGSAAVFLCLLLVAVVWALLLLPRVV